MSAEAISADSRIRQEKGASCLRTSLRVSAPVGAPTTCIALILVAVIALAAACSSDPTPTSPPPTEGYADAYPYADRYAYTYPCADGYTHASPGYGHARAGNVGSRLPWAPAMISSSPKPLPGGDLIALFSETEAACVRDTLGEEALAMIRDTRLMEISDTAPPIPFECLTPENVGNIGVAMIALQAADSHPSRAAAPRRSS